MLELDFIVRNPDVVRRAIQQKNSSLDLDLLLSTAAETKSLLQDV